MEMQELSASTLKRSPERSFSWVAAAGLSAAALFAASKLSNQIRRKPVDLRGKIALITGGSRGLGLLLAKELGEAGCRLALVARDPAELNAAVEQLRTKGLEAEVFPCDVTDENALRQLVTSVISRFSRVDLLINDAGLIKVGPLDSLERKDFDEAMNLMFWAPVNLTTLLLPHMRQQGGGHIVNISSVGGRVSIPHLVPYSCAKFALTAFSTGLSSELNPHEIHVLTVIPGLMRTGSYLNASFKGQAQSEFGWFGLLGNLPGFSVSAGQAAREIREAIESRRLTCTISIPAKILIQAEALLPEETRYAMQAVGRALLPGPNGSRESSRGKALEGRLGGLFRVLTALGKKAASDLNE